MTSLRGCALYAVMMAKYNIIFAFCHFGMPVYCENFEYESLSLHFLASSVFETTFLIKVGAH